MRRVCPVWYRGLGIGVGWTDVNSVLQSSIFRILSSVDGTSQKRITLSRGMMTSGSGDVGI